MDQNLYIQSIGSVLLSTGLRQGLLPGRLALLSYEDEGGDYHFGAGRRCDDHYELIEFAADEIEVLDSIFSAWAHDSNGRPDWVDLTVILDSHSSTEPASVNMTVNSREQMSDAGYAQARKAVHDLPMSAQLALFAERGMADGDIA